MSNDPDQHQEDKKAPPVDLTPEPGSHTNDPDEIIELTDMVREGKDPQEPNVREEALPGDADYEKVGFSPPAPDTDHFSAQSQEHIDDVLAGLEKEVSEFEKPEDILADIERDEFEFDEPGIRPVEEFSTDEVPPISEAKMREFVTDAVQKTLDGTIRETISEITEKAVHEAVNRAVRETVSEVAEKVIQEAINTLKESIASSEP